LDARWSGGARSNTLDVAERPEVYDVATLAVRSLTPRDVPALRHVSQLQEHVALPCADASRLPVVAQRALAILPDTLRQRRVFVAFVDGELCACVEIVPDARRFVWEVQSLCAGSPHLDAHDDVACELWEALLEYVIARAGVAHIRRVFAAAHEHGVACASLRASGFEAYTRLFIMLGSLPSQPVLQPAGMRRQERGDVWSIHQLYHRITPRAVQFAEARTSSTWELPRRRMAGHWPAAATEPRAYVLETTVGLHAYCQITRGHELTLVELMAEPGLAGAVEFALAALTDAGVSASEHVCFITPAYAGERIAQLEAHGFTLADERLAMIRHTTAPARARARVAPAPALEVGERATAPAGIPSYS
jgi:hypothetical protein